MIEQPLRQALLTAERAADTTPSDLNSAREALATCLLNKDRFIEAEFLLAQIVGSEPLCASNSRLMVSAQYNRACCLYFMERFGDALPVFASAFSWSIAANGCPAGTIAACRSLAQCHVALGRHDEAIELARRACGFAKGTFGAAHAATADATRFLEEVRRACAPALAPPIAHADIYTWGVRRARGARRTRGSAWTLGEAGG